MSRKPDPERICDARRTAILSRLLGTGMDRDRAEARVACLGVESRRRGTNSSRWPAYSWDSAAKTRPRRTGRSPRYCFGTRPVSDTGADADRGGRLGDRPEHGPNERALTLERA